MELQNDLFIQKEQGVKPQLAGNETLEQKNQVSDLATDPALMKMLVRYVRSFAETKDAIEIKGRLIDFIRNI